MSLKFAVKIDWLTLTKKLEPRQIEGKPDKQAVLDAMIYEASHIGIDTSEFEVVNGDGFYCLHVLFNRSGARCSGDYDLEKQGIRVVMSGAALVGETLGQRYLASAIENDWKPTRIDLALDVFNSEVPVVQWYFEYMKLHGEHSQRSAQYTKRKNGDKFTIGARSSEKFMRIYDKAGEQGLGNDWVRLELELKGWQAVQHTPKLLASLQNSVFAIAAMLSLPHFWLAQYIEAFSMGEHVKIDPKLRTKDGREKWLMNTVASVLAKTKVDSPELYGAVIDMVDALAQGYETERDGTALRHELL